METNKILVSVFLTLVLMISVLASVNLVSAKEAKFGALDGNSEDNSDETENNEAQSDEVDEEVESVSEEETEILPEEVEIEETEDGSIKNKAYPIILAIGFAENDDNTAAFPIKISLQRGASVNWQEVNKIREENNGNDEKIQQEIQNIVQEYANKYKGKLTVGLNGEQKHYTLDVINYEENHVEFDVYSQDGKEKVGTRTADATSYDKITPMKVWKGTLNLEDESDYSGEWQITAISRKANFLTVKEIAKEKVAKIESKIQSKAEKGKGFWYRLALRLGLVKEADEENSLITKKEAIEIAKNSDCINEGTLKSNVFYNSNTKTWWIDMNPNDETKKEICNPACVVSEETKTAEINWRCTGLVQ